VVTSSTSTCGSDELKKLIPSVVYCVDPLKMETPAAMADVSLEAAAAMSISSERRR
jgi:hypothetical protein